MRIDEIKVIPPRRRSLRTDTTTTGDRGSLTSSLVNTFDRENRLVQETGESSDGGTFTTTYTSWDEAGRPTAGKTVSRGNINALTLAYDSRGTNVDDDDRHRPAEAGVRADFRRRRQPGGELVQGPGRNDQWVNDYYDGVGEDLPVGRAAE